MILDQIIQKINDNDLDFFEALSQLVANQIKVKKRKSLCSWNKSFPFSFHKDN